MNRITNANLEYLLERINKAKGFNKPEYSEVGSYAFDSAYGGIKLVKYTNEGGGQTDVSSGGFGTKRELYNSMRSMLAVIE